MTKIKIALILFGLAFSLTMTGCADRPEKERSEYGKVVSELPALPERQKEFPLPDGVNDENCAHKK